MRAFILVLDSFGIGASLDAERFGDKGANTFGHIAKVLAGEKKPLHIPHLNQLGLSSAALASCGEPIAGLNSPEKPTAAYGYGVETSRGKDTPSGHWEMAGLPVLYDWGYFPNTIPCFPNELITALIEQAHLPGV